MPNLNPSSCAQQFVEAVNTVVLPRDGRLPQLPWWSENVPGARYIRKRTRWQEILYKHDETSRSAGNILVASWHSRSSMRRT